MLLNIKHSHLSRGLQAAKIRDSRDIFSSGGRKGRGREEEQRAKRVELTAGSNLLLHYHFFLLGGNSKGEMVSFFHIVSRFSDLEPPPNSLTLSSYRKSPERLRALQNGDDFPTESLYFHTYRCKSREKSVIKPPTCRKSMSPRPQPYPDGELIGISISMSGDRGGLGGSRAITIDGRAAARRFMRGDRGGPAITGRAGGAASAAADAADCGAAGSCCGGCILPAAVDVVGVAAVSERTMLQGGLGRVGNGGLGKPPGSGSIVEDEDRKELAEPPHNTFDAIIHTHWIPGMKEEEGGRDEERRRVGKK